MSLPPSESPSKPASRWPLWRRLLMGAALILLASSIAGALLEPDLARWVKGAGMTVGMVLLVFGVGQRMRDQQ